MIRCDKIKVFNFHGIRSVIIAKLRTKSIPKTALDEYKINSSSNGNLMPLMSYVLFPNTTITELNKCTDKK